jgi:RNA polymerase sigma factor (sigma-70 family)
MNEVKYISTRGDRTEFTGAHAIIQGLAPDKGLLVPTEIPKISYDFSDAGADGSAWAGALSEPDIAELLAKQDEEALIADAVDGLLSPDREVFILRYCYLERVKAIAKKLGMTEKAVESRLYRGKLALRQKLSGGDISGAGRPHEEIRQEIRQENRKENKEEIRKEDYEVIIYG